MIQAIERFLRATLPPSAYRAAVHWSRKLVLNHFRRGPTANSTLGLLHRPAIEGGKRTHYFSDPISLAQPRASGGLPVPPPELRMGYATQSEEAFLESGAGTAASLRAIFASHAIAVGESGCALEWGCASGRVLRHFAPEAARCEFWGADPDEACMIWARENLAPPFHFVTCTAFPHLPFEDGKFSLIYGISVMTHIERLRDAWLSELARILRPGGWAVLTIHDERTAEIFAKTGSPSWMPYDLDPAEIPRHEIAVIGGGTWSGVFTFFRSDYIRREWGRWFEVAEIRPEAESYQSAVVLRKR